MSDKATAFALFNISFPSRTQRVASDSPIAEMNENAVVSQRPDEEFIVMAWVR